MQSSWINYLKNMAYALSDEINSRNLRLDSWYKILNRQYNIVCHMGNKNFLNIRKNKNTENRKGVYGEIGNSHKKDAK